MKRADSVKSDKKTWFFKVLQVLRPQGVTGILVLCILGILILAANVWRELAALERISTDTTQWSLMQSEVEILRLQLAVESANSNSDTTDLAELRNWFDVVYARIGMLEESEAYALKLVSEKLAPDARILRSFLDQTVPLIDGPDSELRTSLRTLATMLPEIRQAARRLTLASRTDSAAAADARRKAVAMTLVQTAVLTGLLIVALSGLSWIMLRMAQSSRKQMKVNTLTSARLRTIFATSADAIIVTNRGGWIVDINPAAEVVFGHPRDHALGIHAFDLLLPPELAIAQSKEIGAILDAAAARSEGEDAAPLRIELLAMRANGVRFPVEMSLGTMRIASGGVIVALVRDISDRRQAQMALTSALEQAQAGERTKTNFIAVMSHEMRTPLNGLLGSLELLGATNLGAEQTDLVNAMTSSGQILLHHVNSVLEISKVEADRLPDALVDFDLDRLVDACVANQAGLAATKGLTIRTVTPNGPEGLVTGDPSRLRQILLNLIGNAVKFTAKGQVTVELERSGFGLPVEIRVIDSGIGIPEADLARVFEDFVTLDARYDRQAGGTGLGLGIARRMARAMGGEIGVESVLGDGSLFWLRLPLPSVEGAKLPSGIATSPATTPAAGKRVLVIEDNPVNRFVLRRLLEESGHAVTEAPDGAAGVTLAITQPFDLIMTDISMPGMDGVEVTRQIRNAPGPSQQARVVAVTAHALPHDLVRFRQAGIDDCMTKPITRVSLMAAMTGQTALAAPHHACQILDQVQIDELQQRIGGAATATLIARMIAEGDAADRQDLWSSGLAGAQRLHAFAGSAGTFGATALQARLAALIMAQTEGDTAETTQVSESLADLWRVTRAALVAVEHALRSDQLGAAKVG